MLDRGIAVLAVVLASAVASPARAEPCRVPEGASARLGPVDGSVRLDRLHHAISVQGRRARVWTWAWVITGTAIAAGSFVWAGVTRDETDRVDQLVTGGVSLASAAVLVIAPLDVMADQSSLDTRLARGDRGCSTVGWAERALERDAANEALSAGWLGQLLTIGVNVAAGLLLGLGLDHWRGGLTLMAGGILLGELQIFTQPTGAVDALQSYRAGR